MRICLSIGRFDGRRRHGALVDRATSLRRAKIVWPPTMRGTEEGERRVQQNAGAEGHAGEASFWSVHEADARRASSLFAQGARELGAPDAPFITSTITSPPYANLVDYGSDNQVGFGETYDEYLDSCERIFAEIFKWTRDDGSLWLVADTLLAPNVRRALPSALVPLPFDLADRARKAGWTLREVVIWRKDRTRPWSHRGKLRNAFEYVLLLVKSAEYKFSVDDLRDFHGLKSWWVKYPERHNPWGMAPDNVWDVPIPVQGSWAQSDLRHACPFPPELVRRMISISTSPGDIVFDPFAGSGTVVAVAEGQGRRGFGTELNKQYIRTFAESVRPEILADYASVRSRTISVMTEKLLALRVLKYPKDAMKQLVRMGISSSHLRGALVGEVKFNWDPSVSNYAEFDLTLVLGDDISELERAMIAKAFDDVRARQPLSRYSLNANVHFSTISELAEPDLRTSLNVYTRGRTWWASDKVEPRNLRTWLADQPADAPAPVVSGLFVRQSVEEVD